VANAADKRNENDKKDSVQASGEQPKVVRQIEKRESPDKKVNVATAQETHHNDATTSWSVQVGAFPDVESATKRVTGLKDKGHDAYHLAVRIQGITWYQVRIGHFASRAEANIHQIESFRRIQVLVRDQSARLGLYPCNPINGRFHAHV
jgi:cell division protein FtsN